jgi:O-antigen ligase
VLFPTWPGKRRLQALGAIAVFTVVMRLFIPGLVGTLFSLFDNLSGDPSIQHRTQDYARADVQIAMHPVLGRGFGTYLPQKYGPLDNQYLGTLVETGIIGLAALIFILLAGVYAALRIRMTAKDPVIRDLGQTLIASLSVIIVADATYDAFGFIMATGMCFMLVGICGALWRSIKADPNQFMPITGHVKVRKKPAATDTGSDHSGGRHDQQRGRTGRAATDRRGVPRGTGGGVAQRPRQDHRSGRGRAESGDRGRLRPHPGR